MGNKTNLNAWLVIGVFLLGMNGTVHEGKAWSFDGGTGTILREVWEDVPSKTGVADLTSDPRYPDDPSWREELTSFDFWGILQGYIV